MISKEYVIQTFQFSTLHSVPFYSQLYSYIKYQIQAGVFCAGDLMLSETELCDILHVSRTTVRLALSRLVEEGLLIRFRGKGSFIAEKKIGRDIDYLYNFTESIRETGAEPSSMVLSYSIVEAGEKLAQKLQLPDTATKVFRLERLRCVDDVPLLLEITHIPYFLCPEIEKYDFSHTSLYDTLQSKYMLGLDHAVETIEAIIIDDQVAEKLHCRNKLMPGFHIERISYLHSGQVYEYTTSTTRADACVFRLNLYAKAKHPRSNVQFSRHLNP